MSEVWRALAAPVLALKSADERVYFAYLFGAFALAAWVWARKLRGRISLLRFLGSREIWLHESALFDLRFMAARALLALAISVPLFFGGAHLATTFLLGLRSMAPLPALLPANVGFVLVTGFAFIFEDFSRFVVHRSMHRVPALWELHKVHHSAEVLTPFSIYRTHPIEGFLMKSGAALGLATGAALAAWICGASLTVWEALGVQGLSVVWNAFGSNLRHSHVWLRFPRSVEHVFISPAQHQIHHSQAQAHYDKNFGSVFALWDHWFGSLYVPQTREKLIFGLPESERNHDHRVLSALVRPVLGAAARLAQSLPVKKRASSRRTPETLAPHP